MISVLDSLLAPIARLAVARGILFPQLADRLKLQFLKAAAALSPGDKPPTDSRLSVMTGLQRRDINRLRALPTDPPVQEHPLTRLVALWQSDYAVAALPIRGEGSFAEIAGRIRKDVHPRTLLEQLVTAGTVQVEGDTLTLLKTSYQPLPGARDRMEALGSRGGDYLMAATRNLLDETAHFEEDVLDISGLSAEDASRIAAQYQSQHRDLLRKIRADMSGLQSREPGPMRLRAGGYCFDVKEEGR